MKLKTARRFLARNAWRKAAIKLYGNEKANSKFHKQYRKAATTIANHNLKQESKATLKRLF